MTVRLKDGRRRKLMPPGMLPSISEGVNACFVFDNLQIYTGRSNGMVDEYGDFCIMTKHLQHGRGMAMPYARLIGWAYV